MKKFYAGVVMALFVISTGFAGKAAFAEEHGATVQGGVALPMVGDLDDIADTGIFVGIQAMHAADPYNKYGLGMSYTTFGKVSDQGVDTEVSIISSMAMVHHSFARQTSGSPFFEGGLGFARTQVNIAATGAGGPDVTRGNNEEDFSPTFLLGVGFDMPIAGGATFGVSVDYQHFFFKIGQVDGGGTLNILANLRV